MLVNKLLVFICLIFQVSALAEEALSPNQQYHRAIEKRKYKLEKKIELGKLDFDPENRLIEIYMQSYQLEERARALPLLQKLAEEGQHQAMEKLAIGQLSGIFGQLSTDEIDSYHAVLSIRTPAFLESYQQLVELWDNIYQHKRPELQKLAQQAFDFCPQTIHSSMPNIDSNYLIPNYYLDVCLRKYTYLREAAQRLRLLSQFTDLYCPYSQSEQRCLSKSYLALAKGELDEIQMETLALTLLQIFRDSRSSVSFHTARLDEARLWQHQDLKTKQRKHSYMFRKKQYLEILTMWQQALLEMPGMDGPQRAEILLYMGNSALHIDGEKAVDYYQQALASSKINHSTQLIIRGNLIRLYLSNKNYLKALKLLTTIFEESQKQGVNLLPNNTLQALKALSYD